MGITLALRRPPPTPPLAALEPLEGLPAESLSLRLLFERIGPLVDHGEASRRFRTLIVSERISGVQLGEFIREAQESPHERQVRRALQDLVNAAGERLGLGVRFGAYEEDARGPLAGDGLWQITPDLVGLVILVPWAAAFDASRAATHLLSLQASYPTLRGAERVLLAVTPAAQSRALSARLGTRALARRSRVLELEALIELLRMRDSGALSTAQAAILLAPLDGRRISRTLDALEGFVLAAADDRLPWAASQDAKAPSAAPRERPGDGPGQTPRLLPSAAQAALLRAYRCHKSGDEAGAISGLRLYLAAHPTNLRAWELLGDILVKEGRRDDAVDVYRQGLSVLPRRDALLTKLTRALAARGGMAEAKEAIAIATERTAPLDGHLALARAFAPVDPTASRFHAHQALDELRHAYAQIAQVLSETAMAMGDREEAINVMERALALLGDHAPLKERLATLTAGRRRRFRLLPF